MSSAAARKRILVASLAGLAVCVLAAVLLRSDTAALPRPEADRAPRAAPDAKAEEPERRELPGSERGGGVASASDEVEEFIAHLRERFGPTIDHAATRMALLEKTMAYLQRAHPDDWRERAVELLAKAFPGRADELLTLLEKRLRYAESLEARRADYEALDPRDRRDAIWAERYRIFGDEADAIWASARRAEQVRTALEEIGEDAADGDLGGRLDRYVSAIEDAYGDRAAEIKSRRQTELVNHFLEVSAVQDELRALEPDARAQSLRRIRDSLGMDDAALARWDDLDRRRDRIWAAGREYEVERQRLLSSTGGDDLEASLRDLQDRVFGDAAEMIRAEEESGFYRYERPRRIGRE